ncbi:PKD domain-containing protein [Saccharobesus litoralis]|uniref:PKD domain-containing protein n=1 Tax=Saccharobesus litoralis TaxID=2172099 RepID=UPI001E4EB3D4|nr:PKD domain-containing protein [Saccharobesus litoralis]
MTLFLNACSGGKNSGAENGGENEETPPQANQPSDIPDNVISRVIFRDHDPQIGLLGGEMLLQTNTAQPISEPFLAHGISHVFLYWADANGDPLGEPFQQSEISQLQNLTVDNGTSFPSDVRFIKVYVANSLGRAEQGVHFRFDDFIGNAQMAGAGGNEQTSWYYGDDRPLISIVRQNGICRLDNGLVSVIDMANERDEDWHNRTDNSSANVADDDLYPAYEFACDAEPVNSHREIADDIGVWTYSTLNDAMFYGTLVYDAFVKYFGEPPLNDKIRIRAHYAASWRSYAYWDGAYANFSDAYPLQYSTLSLDSVAHEVAHGVLTRISALDPWVNDLSPDAKTLHEAFADISGVMAKYEMTGQLDWLHGGENHGWVRQLDRIKTEHGAIASFLDYDAAQDNYYRRIGMLTYPFYLLSQQWGIEPAYHAYLNAAKHCWLPSSSLPDAAQCIKQQAVAVGGSEQDVVDAFKTVKIKLFEQGVLSHFTLEQNGYQIALTDNSQTDSQVLNWHWTLGDGTSSNLPNPTHTYAQAGEYQVKLTVTDQNYHQDTFTRQIEVTVEVNAQ